MSKWEAGWLSWYATKIERNEMNEFVVNLHDISHFFILSLFVLLQTLFNL